MKRHLAIALFLLAGLAGTMAQSKGGAKGQSLRFEVANYDFGVMEQGSAKRSHEFVFVNDGQGPIVITRTANSCRCISVETPKKPIQPGDKGVVKVTFDPKDKGVFNKAIEVYANIPSRRVTLLVGGEVK